MVNFKNTALALTNELNLIYELLHGQPEPPAVSLAIEPVVAGPVAAEPVAEKPKAFTPELLTEVAHRLTRLCPASTLESAMASMISAMSRNRKVSDAICNDSAYAGLIVWMHNLAPLAKALDLGKHGLYLQRSDSGFAFADTKVKYTPTNDKFNTISDEVRVFYTTLTGFKYTDSTDFQASSVVLTKVQRHRSRYYELADAFNSIVTDLNLTSSLHKNVKHMLLWVRSANVVAKLLNLRAKGAFLQLGKSRGIYPYKHSARAKRAPQQANTAQSPDWADY